MSAIKSPKSETVINSSCMEITKPSDETILGYTLINKKEDRNTSLQMMAKKMAMSLSKNKTPSHIVQNISVQFSEIKNNIIEKENVQNSNLKESVIYQNKGNNDSMIRANFFALPNSQDKHFIGFNNVNLFFSNIKDAPYNIQFSKENEPAFFQDKKIETNDIQVTFDDTPTGEDVVAPRDFDDEFPLVNINGGIVIPFRDSTLPVKPLLSLSQMAAIPESILPNLDIIDEHYMDNMPFIQLSNPENGSRDVVNIGSGHDKENVSNDGTSSPFSGEDMLNEQLPLSQVFANFEQNLTKNEKKAPVLQEMADIEDVNIVQNRSPQIDVIGEVYREVQTTPLRGAIAHSQTTTQSIEHREIFNSAITNENEPRTFTYTFHQWKNTPSVTFELATKTELIALTQNQEVQETLKENKHLLNSEHDVYFRQEQHQERGQHHQQQEYNQQEED